MVFSLLFQDTLLVTVRNECAAPCGLVVICLLGVWGVVTAVWVGARFFLSNRLIMKFDG